MTESMPKCSIVIPFYNERRNIPLVLSAYATLTKSINVPFELICVNNGSTDDSENVFRELLKKKKYAFAKLVTIKKNKGYGHGIVNGLKKTKGEIVAWTHADMQTDPQDVFRAYHEYQKYNTNKLIIKGRRIQRPITDVLFSLGMALIASICLKKLFFEINAQPKLFHRSALSLLKNAPYDFSFDLYFLYMGKKYGYSIKTIDVYFHKRRYGSSRWAYSFSSKWKTILRTIIYIIALRKNRKNN